MCVYTQHSIIKSPFSLHQSWFNCLFTEKKLSDAAGMGLSLSVDRKSTILSEVLVPPDPVLFDHTFSLPYKNQLKKEMKKMSQELRVHKYVETAHYCTLFVQQYSREQKNLLSVAGVIRLTCGNYQLLVKLFLCLFAASFI